MSAWVNWPTYTAVVVLFGLTMAVGCLQFVVEPLPEAEVGATRMFQASQAEARRFEERALFPDRGKLINIVDIFPTPPPPVPAGVPAIMAAASPSPDLGAQVDEADLIVPCNDWIDRRTGASECRPWETGRLRHWANPVAPLYPQEAADNGIEGYAVVSFDVMPDGTISNIMVVESEPIEAFGVAARRAVGSWRYSTVDTEGNARDMPVAQTVRIDFQLAVDDTLDPQQ